MQFLGDFRRGATVRFAWSSFNSSGASVTRSTNGTVSVYKNSDTTQSTTGVTDTEDFDALTGVHWVAIDTSADSTFYAPGNDFTVVLSAATIDSQTVNAVLGHFSIENRFDGEGRKATAQGGGSSSITLDASASATDDFYNGWVILIESGTGALQARVITDYVGSTKVATVDRAWVTTPDSTSVFRAFPGSLPTTVGEFADGVWDEATAGHSTAGTTGKALTDVLADTGTDGVVVGSIAAGAITAAAIATDAIDADAIAAGAIDASALAADAGTELAAAFWDVADAEETSVPAANAAFRDKVNFLFALARNKMTFNKTTGAKALRNDADSGNIATGTDADDGTTYTKAELA